MGRRFTPEFALSLPIVSDAQISPDGASVAFVVGESSKPSAPPRPAFAASTIHLVPAAGGERRQLTAGRADIAPRWSPDGRSLAFLSDREKDGQRQVHLLPLDGGEARQAHAPRERRPGRALVQPARLVPGRLARRVHDGGAARSRRSALAPRPATTRSSSRRRPGFWRFWAADVATGETRPISPPGLQVWEFAISPDGRRVAAVASDEPYEWDWYRSRVVVFDVGAESLADVRDVHRSWRQVSKPAWSPDGYEVAFLTSNWSDRGVDAGQPMVVSAFGGEARPIGGEEAASDLAIALPARMAAC